MSAALALPTPVHAAPAIHNPVQIATSRSLARLYRDCDFETWCERNDLPTGTDIPRAAYDAAVIAYGLMHSTAPRERYERAVLAMQEVLTAAGVALAGRCRVGAADGRRAA